jgi:hypothetical protein
MHRHLYVFRFMDLVITWTDLHFYGRFLFT